MIGVRRRLFFVALAVAWMAFVFFVSSRPDPLALLPWRTDTGIAAAATGASLFPVVIHFAEYFILASLLRWAIGSGRAGVKVYLSAFFIALAFALTDEFHQRFTPARDSSLADIGADGAGILAALLAWKLAEATRVVRQME